MGKKANRRIFSVVAAMLVTAAYAANDNVSVVTANGTSSFDVESIERIDFGEVGITMVSTDNSETTFAFEEIRKIVFSQTESGIQPQAVLGKSKFTLTLLDAGRQLRVNGWSEGRVTPFTVYGMSGGKVVQIGGWSGESVDISALPHGVYIVKVGNEVAKFQK